MNKIHLQSAIDPWPIEPGKLNTIVTSPPYWGKRNYGVPGQLGQEKTPEEYVQNMVTVFRHAWNALAPNGTLWLNLGDTYMGGKGHNGAAVAYSKHIHALNKKALITTEPGTIRPNDIPHPRLKAKQLVGIPWRVAFALQADGWILRQDIIWNKPNCMPEPVKDRCTSSHEYIFLFVKQRKYFFNIKALREPAIYTTQPGYDGSGFKDARLYKGKNSEQTLLRSDRKPVEAVYDGMRTKRDVWTIAVAALKEAHFASFPEDLPRLCIKAGCPHGGLVGDPFMGAGTTAMIARELNCNYWGMDLNPEYIDLANARNRQRNKLFA